MPTRFMLGEIAGPESQALLGLTFLCPGCDRQIKVDGISPTDGTICGTCHTCGYEWVVLLRVYADA